MDIGKAVSEAKAGKLSTEPTAAPTSTSMMGSFEGTPARRERNYAALIDEIMRAKPAAARAAVGRMH